MELIIRDRIRADGGGSNLKEVPSARGRFLFAQAGGGAAAVATPPFTVVAAPTKDNPRRVRVYRGFLGGLLPEQMNLVDALLPDGTTDNRCYLTALDGQCFIYGKVLVDPDTGALTSASVYVVDSLEEPDSSYLYFQIAYLSYDQAAGLVISQVATGNQSLALTAAPDGTLYPIWSSAT